MTSTCAHEGCAEPVYVGLSSGKKSVDLCERHWKEATKKVRAGIGHNSASGISSDRLRSFVERIERLEVEQTSLAADKTEIYKEAKDAGFEPKIIREIVKLRKMDAADRKEREELLDLYMHALGMLADTPLGEATIERLRAAK